MKATALAPISSNVVGTSPNSAGNACVVEQDHLTVASQAVRHRRVPVIHGAGVMLVEDDAARRRFAESAIGEADAVSLDELRRRGLVGVND